MPPTIRTAEMAENFIAALSRCGNVTSSCEQVGMSRMTAYAWRKEDEAFSAAWDAALVLGLEGLEDEARRRGQEGYDEPVFFQGQEVGVIRKFSDTLLITLLKAGMPDKYREHRTNENRNTNQFLGKDGQPVDGVAVVNLSIGKGDGE